MRSWSGALLLAAVVATPAPAAAAGPPAGGAHHRGQRPALVMIRPVLPTLATGSSVMIARYGFDDRRSPAIADESGHGHTLRAVAAHGGSVRRVVHGQGSAIAFPAECTARICPHVALRSPTSADLNPGTRDIAFGAEVLLPPGQTSKGENIVQKGYSRTSSQWKLQVDGVAGRPSCVLVDDRRPTIRIAYSSASIADGRWHSLQCRRAGTTLAIFVDGVTRGSIAVPSKLSVTNQRPLSIGGKGSFPDNDQFNGALDNVWVQIG
ncbi:LamG-like jellyroll fold domain-containing protein [Actinoplanes sp. NPDC051411]|uniref:LamG-like jellyroll fold domain-containing protein n=1 Tax=Actinoplanes sp. NPDC051411 TaxID=3155522 RepID=UPI00341C0EB7